MNENDEVGKLTKVVKKEKKKKEKVNDLSLKKYRFIEVLKRTLNFFHYFIPSSRLKARVNEDH